MRHIALVFVVCVGMIVLTNCQQTGGGSSYSPPPSPRRLPDNSTSRTSRFEEWQRQKTASDLEFRVKMLETQVIDLTNRLRVVEGRTRPQME